MATYKVHLGCWAETFSEEELRKDSVKRDIERRTAAVRAELKPYSNSEDDFGLHFLTDDEREAEEVARTARQILEANGFGDMADAVEIER